MKSHLVQNPLSQTLQTQIVVNCTLLKSWKWSLRHMFEEVSPVLLCMNRANLGTFYSSITQDIKRSLRHTISICKHTNTVSVIGFALKSECTQRILVGYYTNPSSITICDQYRVGEISCSKATEITVCMLRFVEVRW